MTTATIESVPIGSISPDPANVRQHPDRNLETIKASLLRFGQQKPIVVDAKGIIRAGNGTHAAAKALGWETIQIVRSDLADSEATAYSIADNRTAELAVWEAEGLSAQLEALIDEGFPIAATGFSTDELDTMIAALTTPEDSAWGNALDLPEGDRAPFQQMTFTLSDEQAEQVKRAMDHAKAEGAFIDTGNENSNGNALARICETYLGC